MKKFINTFIFGISLSLIIVIVVLAIGLKFYPETFNENIILKCDLGKKNGPIEIFRYEDKVLSSPKVGRRNTVYPTDSWSVAYMGLDDTHLQDVANGNNFSEQCGGYSIYPKNTEVADRKAILRRTLSVCTKILQEKYKDGSSRFLLHLINKVNFKRPHYEEIWYRTRIDGAALLKEGSGNEPKNHTNRKWQCCKLDPEKFHPSDTSYQCQ